MYWYFATTAAVPVHVVTSPPLAASTEQSFIAELHKANGIVDRLVRTSPEVSQLMSQLREDLSKYDQTVIQDQLKQHFEAALYQEGVQPGMVPGFALMLAYNAVRDIQMVVAMRGGCIVVYFLCKTVKSIYALGQMIMSGFMHAVFAAVIESMTRTTVDVNVYVRADEFNLRLLCLSKPQDKGWQLLCGSSHVNKVN